MSVETSAPKIPQEDLSTASKGINGMRWLVVAAVLLPMIGAYVVFKTGIGMPSGTVNNGTLLTPATSIVELQISDPKGLPIDLLSGKKKWRMVIVGNNDCDQTCMDLLYVSRQVHMRLNEKAVRVERYYFNVDASFEPEFAGSLAKEHSRLKLATMDSSHWAQLFANTNVADHAFNGTHVYYVDQQGFAMMSYDASHEGADLLDDLKRLLKYSNDK